MYSSVNPKYTNLSSKGHMRGKEFAMFKQFSVHVTNVLNSEVYIIIIAGDKNKVLVNG